VEHLMLYHPATQSFNQLPSSYQQFADFLSQHRP
ncbi:hypothetical protein ACFMJX_12480, partial [Acinetobacter baumannii]